MKYSTIDKYTTSFPEDIQEMLGQNRFTVRAATQEAEETNKYGTPTFTLKGNLGSFCGFQKAHRLLGCLDRG